MRLNVEVWNNKLYEERIVRKVIISRLNRHWPLSEEHLWWRRFLPHIPLRRSSLHMKAQCPKSTPNSSGSVLRKCVHTFHTAAQVPRLRLILQVETPPHCLIRQSSFRFPWISWRRRVVWLLLSFLHPFFLSSWHS